MTKLIFTIDEDFACTMFTSCKKVSLVAQASLQSSKSFLDLVKLAGLKSPFDEGTVEWAVQPIKEFFEKNANVKF